MNPFRLTVLGLCLVGASSVWAEELIVDFKKSDDIGLLFPGKIVGPGVLTVSPGGQPAAMLPTSDSGNFLYSLKKPLANSGADVEVTVDFWTTTPTASTPGLALVTGLSAVPGPQSALGYKGADTDGSIGVPRSSTGTGEAFEDAQASVTIALRFSPDGKWSLMAFNDSSRQGTAISETFPLEEGKQYRWVTRYAPVAKRPGFEFTSQIFEVTASGGKGTPVAPAYSQQVANEALFGASSFFAVIGSQQGGARGVEKIDHFGVKSVK
jgi:hypothetical protein